MKQAFIGIFTGLGAGVCLIINHEIKLAISEERLTRIKNEDKYPINGISEIKKILSKHSISYSNCMVGFVDKYPSIEALRSFFKESENFRDKEVVVTRMYRSLSHGNERLVKNITRTLEILPGSTINIIDHHVAHAYCLLSYKENFDYAITCDGRGDLQSLVIWEIKDKLIVRIQTFSELSSLGFLYGQITKLLGYKPHQHEGKITGLAAFGKSTELIIRLKEYLKLNNTNCLEASSNFAPYNSPWKMDYISSLCHGFSKEDIAYAVQKLVEDYVISIINCYIKKNTNVFASGGVFANVKLNQKIREKCNLNNFTVFPAMSDEGLPMGIACYMHGQKIVNTSSMPFWGPNYNKNIIYDKIKDIIKRYDIIIEEPTNISLLAAKLLVEGKILGIFSGRSEFGKRSLGHRSILCPAINRSFSRELNKRLNRSDFMPFAPVTLESQSKYLYKQIEKKDINTNYMTTCYSCKTKLRIESPAVVHIDNTARPQIVRDDENSMYVKILRNYYKISGIPTLINTSFNLHEEPIVETIEDAIKVLNRGGVDALIVEDKWIVKQPNKSSKVENFN